MKLINFPIALCILIISFSSNVVKASGIEDEKLQRIDSLNLLCSRYWMVDQTQSILFGEQALKLATSLDNSEEIAVALRNIGSAYLYKG